MSFSGAVWQGAGLPPHNHDVLSTIDLGGGDQGQRLPCLPACLPAGLYDRCLSFSMGSWLCSFQGKKPVTPSPALLRFPGSLRAPSEGEQKGIMNSICLRKDTEPFWMEDAFKEAGSRGSLAGLVPQGGGMFKLQRTLLV